MWGSVGAMRRNVHGVYLKFTYLWEHAVLFPLSGCTRMYVRGGRFLGLVLDRMVSVFAARLNILYKVSLYVCLSGIMCGDVLQALIVIILSLLTLCRFCHLCFLSRKLHLLIL